MVATLKIEELITELEAIREEHGNLKVDLEFLEVPYKKAITFQKGESIYIKDR